MAHFAEVITDQSKRLGMWMDWPNSYYTFSDTNIEYIWRFLKEVDRRGWLYKGHRSTQWCPRCGTSLSKHEQAGDENYAELVHPSLFVRFPLLDREGESLVVWTTTPWTLPANVAAAVHPDASYGRRANGEWVAVDRYPDEELEDRLRGEELLGRRYEGPFDHLQAQDGVEHRVIPWDEVSLTEGTGIVHIAPGAGTEDFELSRVHGLPVLNAIDESGRMLPEYGELAGRTTDAVAEPVTESLRERNLLVQAGTYRHRYPICWRCKTPLLFRVVDDWFISAGEIRQLMLEANATVEWVPPFYGLRMDDWLRNMGDWNISRKRYFGLPLPFYPCACGRLNVIGSRAELEERAVRGLDQLQELHRPWIDEVVIRCEECGEEARRITEVGDAWLDAGIVHFSTLGWQSPEWVEDGNATGAAAGLTHAPLPDHAYWEEWFPADWVSESREQIRLWFYSQSFMAVTLDGRSPYRSVLAYERVRDETGREMHKSTGNSIEANDALERDGRRRHPLALLRTGPGPEHQLRLRPGGRGQAAAAHLLELRLVFRDVREHRRVRAPWRAGGLLQPLDRWLRSSTRAAGDRRDGVRTTATGHPDDRSVRAVHRRPLQLVHPPVAAPVLGRGSGRAPGTLGGDHDRRSASSRQCCPSWPSTSGASSSRRDESVFLAGWPDPAAWDDDLLAEVDEVRRVVRLGRQARDAAGLKHRQPLRRLVVQGSSAERVTRT